jgi:signal transduction histidine kinase
LKARHNITSARCTSRTARSTEPKLECGALPRRLRGNAVRLRAEVQADEGRHVRVRFEVQDTGPGISLK